MSSRLVYRYQFAADVDLDDVEASLLLALWGTESLHGEAQTRLDAAHTFDRRLRRCVIDATSAVGRDLCRLFTGYLRRELAEDQFSVKRMPVSHGSESAA